jgi:pyruvate dehydrogenase E2 component (dihydrolipoamide acetyltransferase)
MTPQAQDTRREATRIQRTIARRMAASHTEVPDFALEVDVDMEEAVIWRRAEKEAGRPAPSFNDLVVKACATALREHPKANASWADDGFEYHDEVNIGVAVAAPEALIVPVVRGADRLTALEIGAEVKRMAGDIRAGTIRNEDLAGGTFTISNLGMLGVDRFNAMVNPPQAAILAVGALNRVPVGIEERIELRHRMTLVLSCDHRVLYGAEGAAFLGGVRDLLERPGPGRSR